MSYRAPSFAALSKIKIVALLILSLVPVALAEDFKAIDGKEYKNVTVSRVEPDGIVLISSSGISKVYFTELSKEVRERFHYNPMKAAAYSAQVTAGQAAYEKQQEQLRRKVAEQNNKYWIGQGQPLGPQTCSGQIETVSGRPEVALGSEPQPLCAIVETLRRGADQIPRIREPARQPREVQPSLIEASQSR